MLAVPLNNDTISNLANDFCTLPLCVNLKERIAIVLQILT
jgi:hypothetical protein